MTKSMALKASRTIKAIVIDGKVHAAVPVFSYTHIHELLDLEMPKDQGKIEMLSHKQ